MQLPIEMSVGIDPGSAHLGIALVAPQLQLVELFQCEMTPTKDPIEFMTRIHQVLSRCVNFKEYHMHMIIEGPSYGDRFGQVKLERVRTSAVWWAINKYITPYIISPKSIRKQVFGNGDIKAHEIWTELPPDVAAALSCALYSSK
jgi:Holliday junction resolvasome RuvABC endonuclease subunit